MELGIGMCITADKSKNIDVLYVWKFYGKNGKTTNNANILSFGSRTTDIEIMKSMIKIFIESEFEGGRHKKRIKKL